MRLRALLLSCLVSAACAARAPIPPQAAGDARQLLVVTTGRWEAVEATLRRFERSDGKQPWRPVGAPMRAVVGRGGLGWGLGLHRAPAGKGGVPEKREGDGRAPAGLFRIGTAFGYAPAAAFRMPYLVASPTLECVDDPTHRRYNTLVDGARVSPRDWKSAEAMRRPDDLYRLGLFVLHNAAPPVAGRGSCIFLHLWSDAATGTAGCTALAAADVEALLAWLDPAARPLLLQLPSVVYRPVAAAWGLPAE